MARPVLVGAVLYDPKVSVIWDIIRDFFETNGCPMDVVFYTNYELQVTAHLAGHVDIAWNSPLAWVDSQRRSHNGCRAIAMRDTDRDRVSHFVGRKGTSLEGQTIAFGAQDSPQATLIPMGHLHRKGIKNYTARRFDILVGKHGDHIGGELEAFKCMAAGQAAASCMLDLNWDSWSKDGTINPQEFAILDTTEKFDHCVFTVKNDFPREREEAWLKVLHSMSYANPTHREMMDLEGLKAWMPGRTSGFGPLTEACEVTGFFADKAVV